MKTPRIAAPLLLVALLAACSKSPAPTAVDASAALPQQVAELETRVTRLADINSVKRLQRSYGYYLDRSEWDEVVDLLTDDATAEYGFSGVFIGKSHIRELLYGIGYGKRGLQPQQLREHLQLQPVITLSPDGQTAKGRWRLWGFLGQYGQYARWQTGPYESEYRKENGVWKISKLHWAEQFTVPFEGGWSTKMEMTNVADRKLPQPDQPTSFQYEPWPAVSLLPYHFGNPVTQPPAPAAASTAAIPADQVATRLAAAQQQLQLLEDERDIETLQQTYGYYVDKNLWVQVSELFADNGTLEIGGRGVFVGKKRVLDYLQWLGEPKPGRLYDHTQLQGVVHVSPDGLHAKARWRTLPFVGELNKISEIGDVMYENEYIKDNGKWKIATLHAYFLMYTDLSKGWDKQTRRNSQPEATLPPDLPPSVVYKTYPDELSGPYHYQNPVTGAPVYPAVAPTPVSGDAAAQQALVEQLAQRTSKLEALQQLERLQHIAGYYFDARDWDNYASLFTANATMERDQRGVYVSQARIKQSLPVLFGEAGLKAGNVHQHLYYQGIAHVADDGQSANMRIRTVNLEGDYQGDATWGGGVFENRYVKENNVWKLQQEHLYTTFYAGYKGAWSHAARPMPGVSTTLPPDQPPSMVYQSFPGYSTFPFHYVHPVTGQPPLP